MKKTILIYTLVLNFFNSTVYSSHIDSDNDEAPISPTKVFSFQDALITDDDSESPQSPTKSPRKKSAVLHLENLFLQECNVDNISELDGQNRKRFTQLQDAIETAPKSVLLNLAQSNYPTIKSLENALFSKKKK